MSETITDAEVVDATSVELVPTPPPPALFTTDDPVEVIVDPSRQLEASAWEPAVYLRADSDWHWVRLTRHGSFGSKALVPRRRIRRSQ